MPHWLRLACYLLAIVVIAVSTFVEQAELVASDGLAGDQFGQAVAISADGNTVLVGAPTATVGSNTDQGTAYVFTKTEGGQWAQAARLVASDGRGDAKFGTSVALSSNGSVAVIGALRTVGNNAAQGAAYMFTSTNSSRNWTQVALLTASDGAQLDCFGTAVALSSNGSVVFVGAPYKRGASGQLQMGQAYIFLSTRSNNWTEVAKFSSTDASSGDQFGSHLSLSASGGTALVGSPFKDVDGVNQGAAYVFASNPSGKWTQRFRLTASNGAAGDSFGTAVSISPDGGTALIGSSHKRVGINSQQGAAYVFVSNSSGFWAEDVLLAASDGSASDGFGIAVSLSSNGSAALIGTWRAQKQGVAYYFARNASGTWVQIPVDHLIPGDSGPRDQFGTAVSLSANGTVALVGSSNASVGSPPDAHGAAYIFVPGLTPSASPSVAGTSTATQSDSATLTPIASENVSGTTSITSTATASATSMPTGSATLTPIPSETASTDPTVTATSSVSATVSSTISSNCTPSGSTAERATESATATPASRSGTSTGSSTVGKESASPNNSSANADSVTAKGPSPPIGLIMIGPAILCALCVCFVAGVVMMRRWKKSSGRPFRRKLAHQSWQSPLSAPVNRRVGNFGRRRVFGQSAARLIDGPRGQRVALQMEASHSFRSKYDFAADHYGLRV